MAAITSEPILSVRNLGVCFGEHRAVEDVSLDIRPGETLALVGESGSGKSATALSILRLIEREGGTIDTGSIRLNGQHPLDIMALSNRDLQRLRGNRISMVFQEPMTSLNPVMRVGEQLIEVFYRHRGMRGRAAIQAAEQALDTVRIPEPARRLTQFPHELSGGLRQRVMIAMALACRPEVLIADEPSTALDVTTQAEILQLIRTLQAELGMAVLFITHDMGVVAEMADQVCVLRQGRMVEQADVHLIFEAPKAAYTRDLMAATPRLGCGSPQPLPQTEPVLAVDNLSTSFVQPGGLFGKRRETPAVRNVSLTLSRGETLGLVGESGCGKSTLARSILRLIEPTSGTVALDGTDLTSLDQNRLRPHRRNTQMIFQDPFASLNPRLMVRDLVTEPAHLHGMVQARERRDLAVNLLEKVDLEADAADRFPHQFSGGQRQRICIARALSVRPKVIVADEAVSALDVSIARRVTELLSDIQASEGVALLFISHDIAVVERLSHRIAVMYRGEIVEIGPSQSVLRAPKHRYTQHLLSAVPIPNPSFRRSGTSGAPNAQPRLPADSGLALVEIADGHFVRAEAA
ncbi:ABC transporter ATP-binding protein [Hoeflea prorocentri]|uniref:Glutathione import ATP-binding protein GsiA n=1 Tax=Hoeflea prorocentri TaxID=1922333 RepID=A0A9X3UIV1_9HYPH|nr:ABC transporter ATP-binding protein [Hoeflea prorocentri]MCY6382173.1 ABC transporter ATP-binding protein [Hoeflea prorocentri]MDA5399973.1 ABC transporter ATP-binding protein [Hoeflea prorocentri]